MKVEDGATIAQDAVETEPFIWKDGKFRPICGLGWWDNENGAKSYCHQLGFETGSLFPGTTQSTSTGGLYFLGRFALMWDESSFL